MAHACTVYIATELYTRPTTILKDSPPNRNPHEDIGQAGANPHCAKPSPLRDYGHLTIGPQEFVA